MLHLFLYPNLCGNYANSQIQILMLPLRIILRICYDSIIFLLHISHVSIFFSFPLQLYFRPQMTIMPHWFLKCLTMSSPHHVNLKTAEVRGDISGDRNWGPPEDVLADVLHRLDNTFLSFLDHETDLDGMWVSVGGIDIPASCSWSCRHSPRRPCFLPGLDMHLVSNFCCCNCMETRMKHKGSEQHEQ